MQVVDGARMYGIYTVTPVLQVYALSEDRTH